MKVQFYKYQGTGNDFVMIDNRSYAFDRNNLPFDVKKICDRKFGIGADGLILLGNHTEYDFEMIYYNADGNESTMCGNGGRCIIHFANFLEVIKNETSFLAIDGPHEGKLLVDDIISLKMSDVDAVISNQSAYVLNTGSPHYVVFEENIDAIDVKSDGRAIRQSARFKEEGINVNFVEVLDDDNIKMRTYERGVEDETLSCGTGVTAAAIASSIHTESGNWDYKVSTCGGDLRLTFKKEYGVYKDIWLTGKAKRVFTGTIEV